MLRLVFGTCAILLSVSWGATAAADKPGVVKTHPLSAKQRAASRKAFDASVAQATKDIAADPKKVNSYSARGDALFFLGRFKESVADYEKMVTLNPKLEASHWRRGIAYFYTGQYKQAANQF